MPIASSLQPFVDSELGRSAALIASGVREIHALLRDAGGAGASATERALHGELGERLRRHAGTYQASFVESLASRVRAELLRNDGGTGMAPPSGLGGLTLMDESRVEIDIELSRATQLIDDAAEWELRELQTFTSTLIGQAHVSAESNPLRPMLYAAALWDAACVVHPGQGHRAALLRLSAVACAPLLKRAWAGASTRLEAAGVTPGVYRSRVMPDAAVRTVHQAATRATGAMGHLLAAMPGGATDLQQGAERFDAAPRALPTPPTAAAARECEAALGRIDEVLRELPAKTLSRSQAAALTARLAAHRSALVAASTPREGGPQIVELLARVFDALLADPEIQPTFLTVVARLQVPALRLALRDPASLASTRHPLWQLLDRIGQASALYPQASDPRGAALLVLCVRLADGLVHQPAADAELCRKALARLDEFLAAQHDAQCKLAERQVQALRAAEAQGVLEHQLAQRLAEQMAPLRPSPAVRRFLLGAWARVLATALVRQGEDDEPARGYIRLVDDLLWSVQSPDHPASRQRLAGILPAMLQCLRDGMASIALPAAEQRAVLDELHAIHTAALERGASDDTPVATTTQAPAWIDAPAPREASSSADSMIDVASLETVPAALLPSGSDERAGDGPVRQVRALRPADRLRMFVNGRWARVQLLWRSDHGDFLLFAGEALGETHSITRRALERLSAAGLVRPLEDQPASQRAFETVERRLALA